jgi:diguanylate cyclase (GGDEF)-like protein
MSADRAQRVEAELVPIADRLRWMQVFRLAIAGVVVVFGVVASDAPARTLGVGTAVFVVVSLAGALAWRAFRNRGLSLFGGLLIVDGAYLAWVASVTGGSASPLRHLVVLHLVTVALLASYRTGLKLAIWHSLLLLLVFELERDGGAAARHVPGTSFEQMVTFIGVVWLAVLATTTFSAVNERELRRRRYDLEALADLAGALEQVGHSAAVADVLVDRVIDTFGFPRAVLVVPMAGGHRVLASRGTVAPTTAGAHELLSVDVDVIDDVIESRRTLLLERLDARADAALHELLPDARNLVIVPLLAEGGAQGVLVAEHALRSGSRIERRVVTALERFASHAALSLRNAALLEEMERMALTDALTGVANRGSFESAAEAEVARAGRTDDIFSVVLLDIDNFKRLNDTFGHREGDGVLRLVASVLKDSSRPFDTVARYGGEEFALVLPGCRLADAERAAERVRSAVASLPHAARVTVSAGVASYPQHGDTVDALVRAADFALYAAKRSGRNRVLAADAASLVR